MIAMATQTDNFIMSFHKQLFSRLFQRCAFALPFFHQQIKFYGNSVIRPFATDFHQRLGFFFSGSLS